MNYKDFDRAISVSKPTTLDRAVAILWLARSAHEIEGMTPKEIAKIIESDCGHPRQNPSRLHEQLRGDQRTAKHGREGFRLRPDVLHILDQKYGHFLSQPKKPKHVGAGSIIPREIFEHAERSYLTRVVDQLNGCYDNSFFDGCTVLARRLLETLVIEVYLQNGRSSDIKRADGSFLGFDDLIGKISSDIAVHVTRETKKALVSVKKLGDQSAHNPRFTARQADVDDVKQGFRIATEELLNLCHYKSAA